MILKFFVESIKHNVGEYISMGRLRDCKCLETFKLYQKALVLVASAKYFLNSLVLSVSPPY
jgi:hypothetical protein